MDSAAQVVAVFFAAVLVVPVFQVVKLAGGWKDLHAQLLSYLFALAVGAVIAAVTGLVSVTWPPVDPNRLVAELLAVFGVVNAIAQIVYREWQKRAGAEEAGGPAHG